MITNIVQYSSGAGSLAYVVIKPNDMDLQLTTCWCRNGVTVSSSWTTTNQSSLVPFNLSFVY